MKKFKSDTPFKSNKLQRNLYLQLCQINSIGSPKQKVIFDNIYYYPCGYLMTFKNGNAIHTAVLEDLNEKSIIYAKLEKVMVCTNEKRMQM